MKSFKALLLVALVTVIGGGVALYGAKYLEEEGNTQQISEGEEEIIEPEVEQEELEPGSYLIFENRRQIGERDRQLGYEEEYDYYRYQPDGELELFATINHPQEVRGALTTSVYGQNLLMHRYQDDEQDGVLSLTGEVLETRPEGWSLMRSPNGRFEIDVKTTFVEGGDHQQEFTVIDTEQNGEIATFTRDQFGEDLTWELYPYFIDNAGSYFYVKLVCGCEGTFPDQWEVNIETGEVRKISDLLGTHSNMLTSLDPVYRRMLSITAETEPSLDGPYLELLPPTTIELLDLDEDEPMELLVDEERAWDRPFLDPMGHNRYILRLWAEGNQNYMVTTQDGIIEEDHYLTDGWVTDWVETTIVVWKDESYKLINADTKVEIDLKLPTDGYLDYIGSITIE
jgi:hypothetical protein